MEKFKKAMNLIDRGDLEQAKEIFEDILMDDPRNIDALYNLGMCFTGLGHPEKAIKTLEQCIKYKPGYSNAYVAMGFAYSRMKDFENAQKHFFEALKIDPNNSFALRNLGGLFGGIGEIEKSLYYLVKAYEINPSDPNTVYGLGYAYEKMKDFKKADQYYNEVLKMNAPANLKNLAKDSLREIAVGHLKAKGFRMDAVFHLLSALKLFEKKSEKRIRDITFEIGLKGQSGFDINNPDKRYTLKTLQGEFTGLQLVCYMYVGFKRIEPSVDKGYINTNSTMARFLFATEWATSSCLKDTVLAFVGLQ